MAIHGRNLSAAEFLQFIFRSVGRGGFLANCHKNFLLCFLVTATFVVGQATLNRFRRQK